MSRLRAAATKACCAIFQSALRKNLLVPTAQTTYAAMVKTEIAPRLRALGFKGSGQVFQLPDEDHWAMIGFQKSTSSDAARVKFTVNVLVVTRAAWVARRAEAPYLGERPSPNVHAGGGWWRRIGELLPDRGDLWWQVESGADTSELAAAVLWAIEDFALPAMRDRMRDARSSAG
jgi:hypothetical protein